MSEKALKDLNMLPESGRKNKNTSNGSLKPEIEQTGENLEDSQKKVSSPGVENPMNVNGVGNSVPEVGNSEVEYIESENLKDVEDLEMSLKTLLAGLDSKDWVLVCEALNDVRRLSIFHKEMMLDILGKVVTLIVKSLKNPRSAVCKTAIMTSSDIFKAYGDNIIDSLDPMLVQLLLKASQDKRFVCEAAERALVSMTTWVSPVSLLPKLQPYLKNRNPRIRAKAAMCFSRSVPRLDIEGIKAYGIDKLIEVAASQLSDQLPESREAARGLLVELQTMYEKSHILSANGVSDDREVTSWENFCQTKLSPLSAQAVLRVTNIVREGLVLGS
ncbi:unnamed protein product [Coffea canephora]|uniref:TOG domain-containing protein n=2 Tax=Coffea TaxID=13442 RepID=A0A068U0R7_COFCA|nr:uncharacterized protein LOC113699367 [Coffea arabica]XP_027075497.1 uncharacterized protein LOC113699367 [Coffea arabica]CDP02130.1 unnamed protein product [Coffea canephora]